MMILFVLACCRIIYLQAFQRNVIVKPCLINGFRGSTFQKACCFYVPGEQVKALLIFTILISIFQNFF